MKIETIEIFGFVSAIKALRLPYKSTNKSDSAAYGNFKQCTYNNIELKNSFAGDWYIKIGDNDLSILQRLIKNGDEHAKVVRGINVSCSIIAPRYWWQEMDTYRFGTDRLSSESTMHCEDI